MELDELILLAAASLLPDLACQLKPEQARREAVKQAHLLWEEVLKPDSED